MGTIKTPMEVEEVISPKDVKAFGTDAAENPFAKNNSRKAYK